MQSLVYQEMPLLPLWSARYAKNVHLRPLIVFYEILNLNVSGLFLSLQDYEGNLGRSVSTV